MTNNDLMKELTSIISLLPVEVQTILKEHNSISTEKELWNWDRSVHQELIDLVFDFTKDIPYTAPRAYCPLCENGLTRKPQTENQGHTLGIGMKRHFEESGRHNQCKIWKTLFSLLNKNVIPYR